VEGDVLLHIFGIVKTTFTASGGTPTLEVGVSGNTAIYLAQVADVTSFTAGEIYNDATPTTSIEDISSEECFAASGGQNIIITIGGTGTVTAGSIEFHAFWYPLSSGASVRPA
jgi:hypothetical protein